MPLILGPGFALGVILAIASSALSSLKQGVSTAVGCSDRGGDEEMAALDGAVFVVGIVIGTCLSGWASVCGTSSCCCVVCLSMLSLFSLLWLWVSLLLSSLSLLVRCGSLRRGACKIILSICRCVRRNRFSSSVVIAQVSQPYRMVGVTVPWNSRSLSVSEYLWPVSSGFSTNHFFQASDIRLSSSVL